MKVTERFEEWCYDHPGITILGILTITPAIIIGSMFLIWYSLGVRGFGPEYVNTVTVQRLYVDGGSSSHYIVGTDKGVYEIDNILFPIQLFNCDELYSKLEVSKTYKVKVKGNKVTNWFVQQYPYIIEIE
jgi:hypothetical protein